jgi:hypothetical protein
MTYFFGSKLLGRFHDCFNDLYDAPPQPFLPLFHSKSSKDKLELLLCDHFSPMLAFVFLAEFEPKLLIKMTRWMETCEGPKIDSAMPSLSAKLDRFIKQSVSNTLALVLRGEDEPSQMGALAIVMYPIDCNGTHYSFFDRCYPEPVTGFIETPQKLGELNGHFGFEEKMEPPVSVIIRAMELSHSTDGTRNVTR